MNNPEQIINECFGESIQKIYPYFVYQQINEPHPVFHFFEGLTLFNPTSAKYYGKAWCKHTFELPYRKSLVPLDGDRIRSTNGNVIEIVHLVLA